MIFKLTLCIFFSVIILKTSTAQVNWVRQTSPVTSALFNCVFTDTLNGWAAGEDGIILHTSDGGNNWVIQSNPVDYYINDIFFINKNTGWCVSNEFLLDGTTLIRTTNGGNNWTAEPFPDSTVFFRSIFFLDSLNGYMAGFFGAVYKTTDGGNNWNPTFVDTSIYSMYPINKIKFLNAQTGFACGGIIDIAGVIWTSTDSGNNWSAADYAAEPFYDFSLKDPDRLFTVGGDFEFGAQYILSSNSGVSWNYNSLGFFGQGQSIDYRTKSEIWMALGFSGAWAYSDDTGHTWVTFPTTDIAAINSVKFVDSLHGWAVGNNGAILKYVPDLVSIMQIENVLPDKYSLSQNYPNPFNPKTVINYELQVTGNAKLMVFDVLGKEVITLVNEKQTAGNYSVEFDGSGLTSGIYIYRLESNGIVQSKKMLLIK